LRSLSGKKDSHPALDAPKSSTPKSVNSKNSKKYDIWQQEISTCTEGYRGIEGPTLGAGLPMLSK